MNENEQERRSMMARPVPARPKGAPVPTPPPPLDELLQKRKVERAPAKFEFVDDEEKPAELPQAGEPPTYVFHDFVTIMRLLRKYPKPTRKQMVGLIAEMLLE